MRVAFRLAHDMTQWQVADCWNRIFPGPDDSRMITAQSVSYWETWPHSGRQPTMRTYLRLARIYQCSVGDLADDSDYGHLDPAAGRPGSRQPPGAWPGGPPDSGDPPAAPSAGLPECVSRPAPDEDPQAWLVTYGMQVIAGMLERMALSMSATAEMLRFAYAPEDLKSPPARDDPATRDDPVSPGSRPDLPQARAGREPA